MEASDPIGLDETQLNPTSGAPLDDDATLVTHGGISTAHAHGELERGELVGRYVILHKLGAGGMGVVYAAYDPELDRKIALKLMRVDTGQSSPEARIRMLREAQAMAKLADPNVVAVHDVGEHHSAVYLAMEYIEGRTLSDWRGSEARPWAEALPVFIGAARGLAAAHQKGLVHRDFKPDNVMVGDDGRVRVMDFGLARPDAEGSKALYDGGELSEPTPGQTGTRALDTELTRAGSIVGTPAYMAPEQYRAQPADPRTDQFAFCVALWEAVFGQRPFTGDTLATLAAAVVNGKRRPPPRTVAVPTWLTKVLERGLSPAPAQRFDSMDALLAAIESGRARRRKLVFVAAGLGLAVLAGGAWGGVELERRDHRQACYEQGADIESSWGEGAHDHLRAAFTAVDAHAAEVVLAKATPWFEGWSEAWTTAKTQICLATGRLPEGEAASWEPALLAEAEACLDERRQAFDAILDELAAVEAASGIYQATVIAADLPSPSACIDPAHLRRRPARGHSVAEVARIHAVLARATSARAASEFERAESFAREALAAAEALADAPLRAEATMILGHVRNDRGDYEDAEAKLVEAYAIAAGAGELGLASEAADLLVFVAGQERARYAEARVWARVARANLALLEPDGGLETAALLSNLSAVYLAEGRFDEALAEGQAAVAMVREAHGSEHPDLAAALANVSNVYMGMGEIDKALALGQEALAVTERTLGSEHPRYAADLNALANANNLKGEHEQAKTQLEHALAIDRRVYGERHPHVATTLNNLAALQFFIEDYEGALANLDEAVAIREVVLEPNHPDLATALSNIGHIRLHIGEVAAAREPYARALAMYEATHDHDTPDMAPPHIGLAKIDLDEGKAGDAVVHARKAIEIREGIHYPAERLAETRLLLARALWAWTEASAADRSEALAQARRARASLVGEDGSVINEALATEIDAWLAEAEG